MIETARHDGHLGAEPALNLVGNREGEQEIGPARIGVLGHRQHGTEVVRGMAQPSDGEVRVEQVGIADQTALKNAAWSTDARPPADERRRGRAAELVGLPPDRRNELTVQ